MSIPQDYVDDANLRMEIYRKIAAAEDAAEELLAELTDRFGPPPTAVLDPARGRRLSSALAETLRVQSISAKGRS